jgi:hypothetical protein
MSMEIPVLGSAFGILAAAFIGAVQALDEAPRARGIMPIIVALMGVKFRIVTALGDRPQRRRTRSSSGLDWSGQPTARNAGSVVAACH